MTFIIAIIAYIYLTISGKGNFTPFQHLSIILMASLIIEIANINRKLQKLKDEK